MNPWFVNAFERAAAVHGDSVVAEEVHDDVSVAAGLYGGGGDEAAVRGAWALGE